ncbi:hypothetical protein HPB48_021409 [Haemaphysalis longicornis]|uniref:Uncharacterized protein n=1 Tax=Haemaphysalis longicornis TaxID=44386 RepID=A0A9J6FSL2_HAELO|nr:hypothetical protein HPB48_021409 [Haemaphysalis longicornis]
MDSGIGGARNQGLRNPYVPLAEAPRQCQGLRNSYVPLRGSAAGPCTCVRPVAPCRHPRISSTSSAAEAAPPRHSIRRRSLRARTSTDLTKQAAATLGSGNLRLAVVLPEGGDLNEWVAVTMADTFNQINMQYDTVT